MINLTDWLHSNGLVKISIFWKFHVIRTIFDDARAVSNFCWYLRKCCFLIVISKSAGSMHSRAVLKVILHWYRPKLISETIKCGGGAKIWFHGWLRKKKSHHLRNQLHNNYSKWLSNFEFLLSTFEFQRQNIASWCKQTFLFSV